MSLFKLNPNASQIQGLTRAHSISVSSEDEKASSLYQPKKTPGAVWIANAKKASAKNASGQSPIEVLHKELSNQDGRKFITTKTGDKFSYHQDKWLSKNLDNWMGKHMPIVKKELKKAQYKEDTQKMNGLVAVWEILESEFKMSKDSAEKFRSQTVNNNGITVFEALKLIKILRVH
jgi:hypothetical protein